MKYRSHRYDINRSRPRHGHNYSIAWDIMRHLVLKLNITPERTRQNV